MKTDAFEYSGGAVLGSAAVGRANVREGDRAGAMAPRERGTVGAIIERSAQVSETIGIAQKQAFALADRAEELVGRLAGLAVPTGTNASAANQASPASPPTCAIEVLFEAMDGLDPQVSALFSPLARISHALERLERALG